jgi:hypothetical protein
MKVKKLMALLETLDPEKEVVMAKDPEGNGYSPLMECSERIYRPVTTWSGVLYDEEEDTPEPGDSHCVVLWPVN